MRREATVTEVSEKEVTVEVIRTSACHGCKQSSCSGNSTETKKMSFVFKKNGEVSIGQKVFVEISDKALSRAALIAYGIPLFLFIAGAFVPAIWIGNPTDTDRALSSFVSLAVGLLILWAVSSRVTKETGVQLIVNDREEAPRSVC